MKTIQIKITGADAHVEQATVLTAGMVGMPVEFTFDDSWDGFQKTAVFTAGGVSRDVVDVENGCTVPPEVMTQPYRTLRIGIYGVQGNRVLPTVWADAGQILPGADPSGDPSAEPTLPLWQQLQQNMVRSVNEQAPDENGNVQIEVGAVDLSGYYTKAEVDQTIDNYMNPVIPTLQRHDERITVLDVAVGDISTALDSIIALQERLIGGDGQ